MDKRRLHHTWTYFRLVKPWYFLILAVISLGVAGFALRANNLQMARLRDTVYTADKNNTDVEAALRALRDYVNRHMNTELANGPNAVHPPIQLKYTYERLVNGQPTNSGNGSQVYTDAQHYCEQTIPDGFSGSYRLSCIQTYVQQHQATAAPTKPDIPKNLYQFDFVSPWWSPDLAGWSLVAAVFFGACFIVSLITQLFIKRTVR